jgi:hypothetical protein
MIKVMSQISEDLFKWLCQGNWVATFIEHTSSILVTSSSSHTQNLVNTETLLLEQGTHEPLVMTFSSTN